MECFMILDIDFLKKKQTNDSFLWAWIRSIKIR